MIDYLKIRPDLDEVVEKYLPECFEETLCSAFGVQDVPRIALDIIATVACRFADRDSHQLATERKLSVLEACKASQNALDLQVAIDVVERLSPVTLRLAGMVDRADVIRTLSSCQNIEHARAWQKPKQRGRPKIERNQLWIDLIEVWGAILQQPLDYSFDTITNVVSGNMWRFVRLASMSVMDENELTDDTFRGFWRRNSAYLKQQVAATRLRISDIEMRPRAADDADWCSERHVP